MSNLDLIRGRQVVVYLTNKSGGSVAAGDVVIIDTSNNDAFTTTTSAGFTGGVGIAQESIANNASGRVLTAGYASLVNVNASVTRGHFGKTHTVAKQATDAGASRGVGTFCQFLTGGTTPDALVYPVDLNPTVTVTGADYGICQGRLTLTSGTAITTTDVTAATTLYFTPYRGNLVGTYSGSAWSVAAFTEKSITLASLTAGLPYDCFIVDSTLALELLAWTNATTRATALTTQDGVLVKNGALTRRYLGTICIAATGQSEDSYARRFVWNYYNRVRRPLKATDSTDSWTYGTASWQAANNTVTNHQVECVLGLSEDEVRADLIVRATVGSGAGSVGIGIDSTSANSAIAFPDSSLSAGSMGTALLALYLGFPGIGYHAINWLEYARSGTMTFYGDAGIPTSSMSALTAEVWG